MAGPLDLNHPAGSGLAIAEQPAPATYWQLHWVDYASILTAAALLLIMVAVHRYSWGDLVAMLKKRSAAVICIGLGIVAAGIFIRPSEIAASDLFYDLMRRGYVAMFGATVTLIGLYYWLAGAPSSKN